jgi:23S rRNA pseudouridine1911/1915/1917 synthase
MGSDTDEVVVSAELEGERFDKALAALSGLSRSHARRLIDGMNAGWDDESRRSARESVHAGMVLWYRVVHDKGPYPEPIDIGVVYEDEALAVVDKPAGLVTHPGPGNADGTLVSALLQRWPEVRDVGDHPRWGIVHRLDRETSGALVIAKTEEVRASLSAALKARTISRRYLSLVHGHFGASTGTIDAPIDRVRSRRVVDVTGRHAVTHYRVAASWNAPELSLLQVRLETGRTHQIRVHFESIEHFLVGDRVYGRPSLSGVDPQRVWLHSHTLAFEHPLSGKLIEATAPVPADLQLSLETLGLPDSGTIPSV